MPTTVTQVFLMDMNTLVGVNNWQIIIIGLPLVTGAVFLIAKSFR
jgi:hypothetical protein